VALTKAAWDAIIDQAGKKWQAFKDHFALENRKTLKEQVKLDEEERQKVSEFESHRYQKRLEYDVQIAEKNLDHLRDVYAFEEQRAGFERDARLRQVEGADAQALPQKIAVEQQKAAIEIDYLEKVHEVKNRLYDMDTSRMLLEEELTLKRLGYKADGGSPRGSRVDPSNAQDIRDQGESPTMPRSKRPGENASIRTTQLVREHNRQIFDSLKAAGWRRLRPRSSPSRSRVEGHRQLAQDCAPDRHQGRGHVPRRGYADADVHRPEGHVRGRRCGAGR